MSQSNVPQFWAKTSEQGAWHPVSHHCLDVAAVVDALLEADVRLGAVARALSPLPFSLTCSLLRFFAAVHDIGKYAPGFQGKVPALAARLGACHTSNDTTSHCDHGAMFWKLWLRENATLLPLQGPAFSSAMESLATAAFAHHGTPLINNDADTRVRKQFRDNWLAAEHHLLCCAQLFLPRAKLPEDMDEGTLRPLSWFAAGLFILADWLGSNEQWFPPSHPSPLAAGGPNGQGGQGGQGPQDAAGSSDTPGATGASGMPSAHGAPPSHLHPTATGTPPTAPGAAHAPAHHAYPGGAYATDAAHWRTHYETARVRARTAVRESGLLAPTPNASPTFASLFPQLAEHAPHPLQQMAGSLPLAPGPQLFILEDLTGGGKTEAALLLAARLMAAGHGSGIFVGLPTQATANAMYARVGEAAPQLFPQEPTSTLLAHGGRELNESFLASIARPAEKAGLPARHARGDTEDDNHATCTPWLADSRKKALLAPCGAGTLDQALLGVLPSRHQALRLLGLARSILIADEVHAFDSYTNNLLCRLLTFHAALGGSAILLSATLPRRQRTDFVEAYHLGRTLARTASRIETCNPFLPAPHGQDEAPPPVLRCTDFPLITHLADVDDLRELPVPPSSRKLDVNVTLHPSPDTLVKALCAAHAAGGCGAWVRNTVDDAVEARDMLLAAGIPEGDVLLFHARFAGCDRQRIERQALDLFGKHSTPEMRRGKILVATQVIEQSLDIDADLLCCDLAPMELLIQRAGRCHRHAGRQRPAALAAPHVLVLSPLPHGEVDAHWYARLFPRARHVYGDTPVLWRTAMLLHHYGALRLPEHARLFVEGAYGEPLHTGSDRKDTEHDALRTVATNEAVTGGPALSAMPGTQAPASLGNMMATDGPPETRRRIPHGGAQVPLPDLTVPEALQDAGLRCEGEAKAKSAVSDYNALNFSKGYDEQASGNRWDNDIRTPTRLGEPTVALRLLRVEQEGLRLWADDGARPQRPGMALCLRSEVKVPAWRATTALCPTALGDAMTELAEQMPDGGRWGLLVPLMRDEDGAWQGTLFDKNGTRVKIVYETTIGLRFQP